MARMRAQLNATEDVVLTIRPAKDGFEVTSSDDELRLRLGSEDELEVRIIFECDQGDRGDQASSGDDPDVTDTSGDGSGLGPPRNGGLAALSPPTFP